MIVKIPNVNEKRLGHLNLHPKVLADTYDYSVMDSSGVVNFYKSSNIYDSIEKLKLHHGFQFFCEEHVYTILYATPVESPSNELLESWVDTLTKAFGSRVRILVTETITTLIELGNKNDSTYEEITEPHTITRLNFWLV